MIIQESAKLWQFELKCRYYQGKVLLDKRYELVLGQTQAEIKELKDWIGFLNLELPSEIKIEKVEKEDEK